MRILGRSARILVTSPQVANRSAGDIANLANHPTLGTSEMGEIEWWLEQEDGRTHHLRHEPRMTCCNFTAVRQAAIAHLGIALPPDHMRADALGNGQLVHLLPGWRALSGIVHLVLTTGVAFRQRSVR